jgi:hypothetical protein
MEVREAGQPISQHVSYSHTYVRAVMCAHVHLYLRVKVSRVESNLEQGGLARDLSYGVSSKVMAEVTWV